MTLITLDDDQKTISKRFRKASYFLFIDGEDVRLEQNVHKTSKSPEFFEYFTPLGIKKIYLRALGYKTFLKLEELGIEVYFVAEGIQMGEMGEEALTKITLGNAQELCTLGHH